MKVFGCRRPTSARHFIVLVALLVMIAGLLCGTRGGAAQPQDARARRIDPTPSPTPAAAQSPSSTNAGAAQNPSPAPGRGTTGLGDAPPPPKLKPTPTPSLEEIDANSVIKIDSQLVNLQIRVIDRSNRPVDNVSKDSFHVYEDGVPQPVE